MNPDPLKIALAASRPISDAPRQPLEVELLLDAEKRREFAEAPQAETERKGEP